MTPAGKILLIDDQTPVLDTYERLLGREGYQLTRATSVAEAQAALATPDWDVVVLDRKLEGGSAGPDTGLDLLADIRARTPAAKIIVVTGYADPTSVRRSFEGGAFDHLEKNTLLNELLPIKVRHAMEASRERRMAVLANGKREETLRKLWNDLNLEKNSQRKGALLEDFVALLFKSIRGFEGTTTKRMTADEEIDLWIPNESPDPQWQKESPFFIGECKNWSEKVDPKELSHFYVKHLTKVRRVKLGFFIALNGFTAGFGTVFDKLRLGDVLIVPLTGTDLLSLLDSSDRKKTLKEFHVRAVLGV